MKKRWVGAYWQNKGLTVDLTISWSNSRSFEFCFDGVEPGAVVAVGMIGCKNSRICFMRGYNEMLKRLQTEAVIVFGAPFPEMKGVTFCPWTIFLPERWCADMGGRGTYASGNAVPYTYETIGKIEGVKILQDTVIDSFIVARRFSAKMIFDTFCSDFFNMQCAIVQIAHSQSKTSFGTMSVSRSLSIMVKKIFKQTDDTCTIQGDY